MMDVLNSRITNTESRRLSAWMIEADGTWWTGRAADSTAFSKDPNEGVRFARFEDAERVKHWLLEKHAFALRSTEHVWMDSGRERCSECGLEDHAGNCSRRPKPPSLSEIMNTRLD